MNPFLATCITAVLITAAPAAVVLTFDTDTQGFGAVDWNAAGGSRAWSSFNGGSLALNLASSGWTNPVAVLDLTSTPALQAEFNAARLHGGTLTFDFIVSQSNITGYSSAAPPGWFQLVAVGNSDNSPAGGGGWDQEVLTGPAGFSGPIPAGPTVRNISMGLAGGAPAGDGSLSFGPGSGWGQILFGLNSQTGSFTSAVVHIDNFSFSANPAPEPAAGGLSLLAAGSLLLRRRR